jgi:hypothetical protein
VRCSQLLTAAARPRCRRPAGLRGQRAEGSVASRVGQAPRQHRHASRRGTQSSTETRSTPPTPPTTPALVLASRRAEPPSVQDGHAPPLAAPIRPPRRQPTPPPDLRSLGSLGSLRPHSPPGPCLPNLSHPWTPNAHVSTRSHAPANRCAAGAFIICRNIITLLGQLPRTEQAAV